MSVFVCVCGRTVCASGQGSGVFQAVLLAPHAFLVLCGKPTRACKTRARKTRKKKRGAGSGREALSERSAAYDDRHFGCVLGPFVHATKSAEDANLSFCLWHPPRRVYRVEGLAGGGGSQHATQTPETYALQLQVTHASVRFEFL